MGGRAKGALLEKRHGAMMTIGFTVSTMPSPCHRHVGTMSAPCACKGAPIILSPCCTNPINVCPHHAITLLH